MQIRTLSQRKAEQVAAKMAALSVLERDLLAYARSAGGRFLLFGSAARGAMRWNSDVDLLIDFPSDPTVRLGLGHGRGRLHPAWPTLRHPALDLVQRDVPGARAAGGARHRMSDARWLEVTADCREAVRHFTLSVQLFEAGGFEEDSLSGYRAQMAFMHAMFAAYTSLETMLTRILAMVGEEAPVGPNWHADLLKRAAQAVADRPAILPDALMPAAQEARLFRHVAVRNDETFDHRRAGPAVDAASVLAQGLDGALAVFRETLD